MGLFDTVVGECEKCGAQIEIQSKSGPCTLDRHWIKDVPMSVVNGILDEIVFCPKCGEKYQVKAFQRNVECVLIPERYLKLEPSSNG